MVDLLKRQLFFTPAWTSDEVIRVDDHDEDGTRVVRAQLPGIDPEKDVKLTVSDGLLRIEAEGREETRTEEDGYVCHEVHVGSFTRTLPLPEGVSEADIGVGYKDGILEIRVPPAATATDVPTTEA